MQSNKDKIIWLLKNAPNNKQGGLTVKKISRALDLDEKQVKIALLEDWRSEQGQLNCWANQSTLRGALRHFYRENYFTA